MENVHGTNEKDEGVSADGDRLYKVRSVFSPRAVSPRRRAVRRGVTSRPIAGTKD